LELELPADEQQIHVGALDLGGGGEADALELRVHHARLGLGGALARPALAGPGEGLGDHDLVEGGLHLPDLDPVEAVVLDAERQRRVGQRAGLRDALPLGLHRRVGAGVLGALLERLAHQRLQRGVGRGRGQRRLL
jgi:hypothetical protein